MIKLLEPRLLRGEAELLEESVSQRRDRGFASLRFRQVAPPTDEAFISRLALRRLQTHLLSDHFLGSVMGAAKNPNSDKWAVSSRQKLFRQNVEGLRRDLQELVVETVPTRCMISQSSRLRDPSCGGGASDILPCGPMLPIRLLRSLFCERVPGAMFLTFLSAQC